MEPRPTLSPPPRTVPLSLRLRVLLGGLLPTIGWAILTFSGFMASVFVANSELSTSYRFWAELAVTRGTVTASAGTNMRHNSETVHRIDFAYEVLGRELRGSSYARDNIPATGSEVAVEYVVDDPATARIQGLRTAPFPTWTGLFVLIFPLAGAVVLALGLRKGRRRVHLLRHGKSAWGLLTARDKTSTRINNQYVYKLNFRFVDDRDEQRDAIARSHRSEFFDDTVARHVLYDPSSAATTIVELLPGPPHIDHGKWAAVAPVHVLRLLLLPAAMLVAIYLGQSLYV